MKKSEMKRAVDERWTCYDDFGGRGSIVGLAPDSDEHLLIDWGLGAAPDRIRYDRATREVDITTEGLM